jgi:hypothetical protein
VRFMDPLFSYTPNPPRAYGETGGIPRDYIERQVGASELRMFA